MRTDPDLTARLRDRLVALCSVASPSLDEAEVAALLRAELEGWNLAVREDGAGAVLGSTAAT
jgi:putative aminopeptidase FrvX